MSLPSRRIAALYDIHGNLPALDAVLDEVRRERVDLVVVGGDVYPGPLANESLDRLLSLEMPTRFLFGNGDRAVLEAMRGEVSSALPESVRRTIEWHAAHLSDARASTIHAWPASYRLDHPTLGRMLFVHATAENDTDIFTELTPDDVVRGMFANANADVVFCGHTHRQFDRRVDALRIVNAGSIGMSFGSPGAHWALIDTDIELRKTLYDTSAGAAVIQQSAYPDARDFAERYVGRWTMDHRR